MQDSVTTTRTIVGQTNDLYIGRRATGSYNMDGSLANVSIHSRLLTLAESNSVMEKSYSDLTTAEKVDLEGWWGLDVAPVDSVTIDSTGNNNGTLN